MAMKEKDTFLEIKKKLTGDVKKDIPYLFDEAQKFSENQEVFSKINQLIDQLTKKASPEEVARINIKEKNLLSEKQFDKLLLEIKSAINDTYYDEALERIEVLEKQVHKVMDSISSLAKEPNPEFQFCFSPMEFSLFSYYYNPEDRDIFLLPYDYVSLLALKSQTNFYLHNYDEARSAMKKALEYNPVSVDVHFLLADMDAAMNNYYSYHADLDRAYTFLYKEQDLFKFYRLLAKYYQATDHNEQLISLLEDLGDEKGGNNLYHRFLLLPDKSKALLDEYKIPYDASDEVIKTCINSAKDALDKDDIKTYKYYYQILINFRNDRAISDLLHNN